MERQRNAGTSSRITLPLHAGYNLRAGRVSASYQARQAPFRSCKQQAIYSKILASLLLNTIRINASGLAALAKYKTQAMRGIGGDAPHLRRQSGQPEGARRFLPLQNTIGNNANSTSSQA